MKKTISYILLTAMLAMQLSGCGAGGRIAERFKYGGNTTECRQIEQPGGVC